MTSPAAQNNIVEEVTDLVMASLCGEIDREDAERLDALLCASDEACRIYVRVVADSMSLRRWSAAEKAFPQNRLSPQELLGLAGDQLGDDVSRVDEPTCNVALQLNNVGFFSAASHGAIGFFSQEMPLGFLIATVLTGLLLLGLWLMPVSNSRSPSGLPPRVAQSQPSPSLGSQMPDDEAAADAVAKPESKKSEIQSVGHITGEVDCQWEVVGSGQWTVGGEASGERKLPVHKTGETHEKQGADATRSPVFVALGDKLAVAAGLLEITFNSGAKVILEGPCRFNVETNGGFLAIGRLTGRMEKSGSDSGSDSAKSPAASSNLQSLTPNPSSLATSHQPLTTNFVIATPTAIVTDLGTEFGIEVDRSGQTETRVFAGEVVAAALEKSGKAIAKSVHLKAGETTTIAKNSPNLVVLRIKPDATRRFVRALPGRTVTLFHDDASLPTIATGQRSSDWNGLGWRVGGQKSFFVHDESAGSGHWGTTMIASDNRCWGIQASTSVVRDFGCDLPLDAAVIIELNFGKTTPGHSMGFALCNAAEQPRFEFAVEGEKMTYSIHDRFGVAQKKGLPTRDSKVRITSGGLRLAVQRAGVDDYNLVVFRLTEKDKYVLNGRFLATANGDEIRRLRIWNDMPLDRDDPKSTIFCFNQIRVLWRQPKPQMTSEEKKK